MRLILFLFEQMSSGSSIQCIQTHTHTYTMGIDDLMAKQGTDDGFSAVVFIYLCLFTSVCLSACPSCPFPSVCFFIFFAFILFYYVHSVHPENQFNSSSSSSSNQVTPCSHQRHAVHIYVLHIFFLCFVVAVFFSFVVFRFHFVHNTTSAVFLGTPSVQWSEKRKCHWMQFYFLSSLIATMYSSTTMPCVFLFRY